jgi:tetratricopeptide (TPR) repeat protein
MTDQNGADFMETVQRRIGAGYTRALSLLSVPHWFDQRIVQQLGERMPAAWQETIDTLAEFDLVERWPDGTWAVPVTVRSPALGSLDSKQLIAFSAIYASILEERAHSGGDVFDLIEAVYHRLACEPDKGSEALIDLGLELKSEPLFAFEALARLLAHGREQDARIRLGDEARLALDFLELFLPARRRTAREEQKLLAAMREAPTLKRPALLGEVLLRSGLAELNLGTTRDAEDLFMRAHDVFTAIDSSRGAAEAWRALGRAALKRDDAKSATGQFQRALEIFSGLGLTLSAAHCTRSLAETALFRGDLHTANRLFEEALAVFERKGGFLGEANTRVTFSQLLSVRAAFTAAQTHLSLARNIYASIEQGQGLANCLKNEGFLLFEQGRYEEAEVKLGEAAERYETWGSASGEASCRLWTAACETRAGRPGVALPLLREARAGFEAVGDVFGQATAFREEGRAYEAFGRPNSALDSLEQALRLFARIENEAELAATDVLITKVQSGLSESRHGEELAGRIMVVNRAIALFEDRGFARYLAEARDVAYALRARPSEPLLA